jgi:tetratricopeptide (TPR) repeat protein
MAKPTARLGAALLAAALLSSPLPAPGAPGDDEEAGALDPDLVAGKAAIEAKEWRRAIAALSSAALRDTRNADIQNYLGFAYRNAGQLDDAFRHYARALALNPRHRGAHEYVGEAYLMVGDLAKAEEHRAALEAICLIPCEELDELREKIEAHKGAAR